MTLRIAKLGGGSNVFVLEQHSEMIEYLEWQKDLIARDVGNLIRGAIPVDRWDHYQPLCAKSLHMMAIMLMNFKEVMPILAHNQALKAKAGLLFDLYDNAVDKILVVNMNGGHQTVDPGRLTDYAEYEMKTSEKIHFKENSKYFIVENDPELDEWTLKNVKVNYSYLTELRKFSDEQLADAFKKFSEYSEKPKTLFVYTTGLDANQMLWYVKIALETFFENFIFVQSADNYGVFYEAKDLIEKAGKTCQIFRLDDTNLASYLM